MNFSELAAKAERESEYKPGQHMDYTRTAQAMRKTLQRECWPELLELVRRVREAENAWPKRPSLVEALEELDEKADGLFYVPGRKR